MACCQQPQSSWMSWLTGVSFKKLEDFRDLKNGDHIAVDGMSSIAGDAEIKKSELMDFFSGRNVLYQFIYEKGKCFSPEEVIHRAEQILLTGKWPGYELLKNNCEHFATFCKKGKAYSNQVKECVTKAVTTIGVGVGLVAAVGGVVAYALGSSTSSDNNDDDDDDDD
ncbi:lecithin retinol acyltransferase-like [Corticium candelabrum]|uniref:lecithin retinol acyltransferase-like n=1 Tax=Corticium candelabrum TaxID=121492 RepID=UPI002E273492|nr:lecithin retinol acyltransferase-like [Corticium candelabrum]